MSMELGESRGRNGALERQVQEVAQLEADEIANLQRSIGKLRQVCVCVRVCVRVCTCVSLC